PCLKACHAGQLRCRQRNWANRWPSLTRFGRRVWRKNGRSAMECGASHSVAIENSRASVLRWASPVTVCLLIGPIAAGLIGTILPAFGYCPPLGGTTLSLGAWRRLFEWPGLWTSIQLSFLTGLITTIVSLGLVALFCSAWHGTRLFIYLQRLLAPLLSVPHAA